MVKTKVKCSKTKAGIHEGVLPVYEEMLPLCMLLEEKERKDYSEQVGLQGDRIYVGLRKSSSKSKGAILQRSSSWVILCWVYDKGCLLCFTRTTYTLQLASLDVLINHVYFEVVESNVAVTKQNKTK